MMPHLYKILKKYLPCILIILLSITVLGGCKQCFFKKTSTGLQYKIIKKEQGNIKPTSGQLLLIDILCKTQDNKIIFQSTDNGSPVIVPYNDKNPNTQDGGIQEAINMLTKGDSIIFKLPAKQLLGNSFSELASTHKLEESTLLDTHMYLKDIKDEEEIKQQAIEEHKAIIKKREEHNMKQLPEDIKIIEAYLQENKLVANVTNSGLRYIIDKTGQGSMPTTGNIVKINYIGKTLKGEMFDTNVVEEAKKNGTYDARRSYEPLEFSIGNGSVIEGFEEGIKLLTKNGKARLYIPSVLAYGEHALSEQIKANSNLIFEIELVDIVTQG